MTHTELCSLNYMDFYFIFIFDLCIYIHVCVCVCEHVHSFPEDQVRALNLKGLTVTVAILQRSGDETSALCNCSKYS